MWSWTAMYMSVFTFSTLLLSLNADSRAIPSSNDQGPKVGYACEGSTLLITCPPGQKIRVQTANYGRHSYAICNPRGVSSGWNIQCTSLRAMSTVAEICGDKGSCQVLSGNIMFGDDCNETSKYLEIRYRCTPDEPTTRPHTTTTPLTTTTTAAASTTMTTPTTTTTTTKPPSSTELSSTTEEVLTTTTIPSTTTTVSRGEWYCESELKRMIEWPHTRAGTIAIERCPNNPNLRAAKRVCGMYSDKAKWVGTPDLSRCVSEDLTSLHRKIASARQNFSVGIMEEVATDLVTISKNEATFGGDVENMMEVMGDMVHTIDLHLIDMNPPQKHSIVRKVNNAVVSAGNNLLASEKKESWLDMPQATQSKAATQLVSSVEESAFQLANTVTEPETIVNFNINIKLEINVVKPKNQLTKYMRFPKISVYSDKNKENEVMAKNETAWKGNSFQLPYRALEEFEEDDLARVVFLQYNNLEQWLHPQGDSSFQEDYEEFMDGNIIPGDDDHYNEFNGLPEERVQPSNKSDTALRRVNSQIISASINGRKERLPLAEPITYTLEHLTTKNIFNPTCSFWDYAEKTFDGDWSEVGCKVLDTNTTHTVCSCDHLTNFAILMDVHGTELSSANEFGLTFVTYAGCIISIVCLFLAFWTFTLCKNLQCDRNTIHKNLCLSLFLAEFIFLIGVFHYQIPVFCSIVAALLHYFFLASFAWMCVEGIQLYVMLIEVFESERSRVKYYYLGAYGLPAIVVGISAAVDHTGYGTDKHCWLNAETGFIWAFVGPVIAVISVNMVMLGIAIYMMCKHASTTAAWKMKQKSKLENIRSWIKGAVVLVVLLGLTWTFGLLYMSGETVAVAYIFTILNSLQGLFIYIFHCVMNDKVQKEYKRWVRHATWMPESIRTKYGGVKPYMSSTPNQSTSSANYFTRLLSRRRKRSSTTSLPKSSSSNKAQWQYRGVKTGPGQRDSGESGIGSQQDYDPGSNIYSEPTEDPSGYLEPVRIRLDDHMMESDYNASLMEGSIVDTDYMCGTAPPISKPPAPKGAIDVDKYKIKKAGAGEGLCPLVTDSEFNDCEILGGGGGGKGLPISSLEQQLISEISDDEFNGEALSEGESGHDSDSDDSCKKEPFLLNNLDKSGSPDSVNLSSPNINYKGKFNATIANNINPKVDSQPDCMQKSLPDLGSDPASVHSSSSESNDSDAKAVEKVKNALHSSNDGLISLFQGTRPEFRFSKDTEEAMESQRCRIHSSDC